MHRTSVMDLQTDKTSAPHIRREECNDYVDLARRMSIPEDDAIRQFIDGWVMKIRVGPSFRQ